MNLVASVPSHPLRGFPRNVVNGQTLTEAAAEASAAAADRSKAEALRAKLIDMEDTVEGLLEMYMEAKQLRPAMKLCAICGADVSEA